MIDKEGHWVGSAFHWQGGVQIGATALLDKKLVGNFSSSFCNLLQSGAICHRLSTFWCCIFHTCITQIHGAQACHILSRMRVIVQTAVFSLFHFGIHLSGHDASLLDLLSEVRVLAKSLATSSGEEGVFTCPNNFYMPSRRPGGGGGSAPCGTNLINTREEYSCKLQTTCKHAAWSLEIRKRGLNLLQKYNITVHPYLASLSTAGGIVAVNMTVCRYLFFVLKFCTRAVVSSAI